MLHLLVVKKVSVWCSKLFTSPSTPPSWWIFEARKLLVAQSRLLDSETVFYLQTSKFQLHLDKLLLCQIVPSLGHHDSIGLDQQQTPVLSSLPGHHRTLREESSRGYGCAMPHQATFGNKSTQRFSKHNEGQWRWTPNQKGIYRAEACSPLQHIYFDQSMVLPLQHACWARTQPHQAPVLLLSTARSSGFKDETQHCSFPSKAGIS